MTWQYVAGFFDGEGCVQYKPTHSCFNLQITQSMKQDAVLFQIQEFLTSHAIRSQMQTRLDVRVRHLRITNAEGILLFLRQALPYLIVKKQKAELAIVDASGIVDKRARMRTTVTACINEYKAGASMNAVAKKYGTSRQALLPHFRKHGVHIRPLRESQQIFLRTATPAWIEQRRQAGLRGNKARWAKHQRVH